MSQEQVEAKLVEQTTSIVEVVKKINEVLKETRVEELCKKLSTYTWALKALVERKHYLLRLQFVPATTAYAGSEYTVRLYSDDELVASIAIERGATIDVMFEKIFTSQEVRDELVGNIYKILVELAEEIASKANLVERIKSIEERLREEDPDPVF